MRRTSSEFPPPNSPPWSDTSFVSRWITVDQERIDAFAKITEDEQFIHVDPERAAETAFGGTVAHGFLTLSLLSAMAYSALPRIEGAAHGVNYGFDRVRFVRPVPSGSRVRGRFTLRAVTPRSAREWRLTYDVSVEIEGARKAGAGGDLAHDAGDGTIALLQRNAKKAALQLPHANRTASPDDGAVSSPSHITRRPRTIVPTGQPVTVFPS